MKLTDKVFVGILIVCFIIASVFYFINKQISTDIFGLFFILLLTYNFALTLTHKIKLFNNRKGLALILVFVILFIYAILLPKTILYATLLTSVLLVLAIISLYYNLKERFPEPKPNKKIVKVWEDYDLIQNVIVQLLLPILILSFTLFAPTYQLRIGIILVSFIVFILMVKFALKLPLKIFLGAYQYSENKNNEVLKKLREGRSKKEIYSMNLTFHIVYAYIFTLFVVAIPVIVGFSSNPFSNINIQQDLIALISSLLVAVSIITALMNQSLSKFNIYKQTSSLLPFTAYLFVSILSLMTLIFDEIRLSLVLTAISMFLLFSLMGSFLFYSKLAAKRKR
ncbi:MAG: hypothetical protein KGI06_01350 [Candidatus Micrarchaeota archaeon]|nr:hypothetical protein [Candidatus Micrarchaeota archaeon]